MITVVAALIERDGKLLACQRKRGDKFELLWEFPGGKVEPGEAPRDALARELREELGIQAEIGKEVYRTCHHYAEMAEPLELLFFSVAIAKLAAIRNMVFEQVRWFEPALLSQVDFLPADRKLIAELARGALPVRGDRKASPRKSLDA